MKIYRKRALYVFSSTIFLFSLVGSSIQAQLTTTEAVGRIVAFLELPLSIETNKVLIKNEDKKFAALLDTLVNSLRVGIHGLEYYNRDHTNDFVHYQVFGSLYAIVCLCNTLAGTILGESIWQSIASKSKLQGGDDMSKEVEIECEQAFDALVSYYLPLLSSGAGIVRTFQTDTKKKLTCDVVRALARLGSNTIMMRHATARFKTHLVLMTLFAFLAVYDMKLRS
ncbi:MAG: hypothetical protein H6679_00100 [Epsilonproteobacteria bacterium]|nr:hypothetical protein [Campylobacterota bacterium]